MDLTKYKAEVKAKLPCITRGCDGDGSIPVMDSEGDWEQAQCEYCFTVRFPLFELIENMAKEIERETLKDFRKWFRDWEPTFPNSEPESVLMARGYNLCLHEMDWKADEYLQTKGAKDE